MTPPERGSVAAGGNVAALRYRLPVSAERMDPLEQIEAMVAGVTEIELNDSQADLVPPPPDLLERTLAAVRAARGTKRAKVRSHDHNAPAACFVSPARLKKIRDDLRDTTSNPAAFEDAIDELVTEWPNIAVAELVVSYSVHNTRQGGPYDATRRDIIADAIVSLGPAAIEGMLEALLVEERETRVLAAIELSPIVGEDSCVVEALIHLIDHASLPVGDFAAKVLRHIQHTSASPEPPQSISDPGLMPEGHR